MSNDVLNAVCNAVTRSVAKRVRCCVQIQSQNQTVSYVGLSSVDASFIKLKSVTREGCWMKAGWLSGETYCGRHGRAAGWPCREGD